MDDSNSNRNFSRDFLIGVGQTKLIQDSQEAQKGSAIGEAGVLNTVQWLKNDGLLKEALEGLEENKHAKVRRDKDQNITEIVFDAQHDGYPKREIKVDLKNDTVNNKKKQELEKASDDELAEFLKAKIDAPVRELDEGENPLTKLERDTLKSLSIALMNEDLNTIKSLFQRGPKDEAFWQKVVEHASKELQFPSPFVFGKDGDRPYLAIHGIGVTGEEKRDAVVIYGSGESKVVATDAKGDLQLNTPSSEGRTAQQITEALSNYLESNWVESIREIRCEFDSHDRQNTDLGKVSWQKMIERYNTYTDFHCQPH
ncbi:MAG: hypothetical protein K2X77_32040 [Candidatus Obscuribacterales bacterium]|jgi:hypothetical protein|nr:hypothetical protein [Candidatus Obscuribacterales bacterium]